MKVEDYLNNEIERKGSIHISLLDPEKLNGEESGRLAKAIESAGSTAIMIGGSLNISESLMDEVIRNIKENCSLPVIIFPNNVNSISRYADAIWFMSLLNSTDPYFIIGAQVQGAAIIRRYSLEAIPMAYIILGDGGTAGIIGQARPLPPNKADVVALYALAAQYLGMRYIYLEGGSGVPEPIPYTTVGHIRKLVTAKIIVGGGIREGRQAEALAKAGADVIVTGTILEEEWFEGRLKNVVEGVHSGGRWRIKKG
ncbi:MAG: geranylgeranylglyceryl/heptaprenylglyceryl phosphate synthase [Candidatus Nezhaarchaeota archaeon]|nr:geranylgeranylglyceryl/heptaprenylglyceryl phosphate synthase [Candidatus Nezhaarchaeota archaeon]